MSETRTEPVEQTRTEPVERTRAEPAERITPEVVRHLAGLARIGLSEQEITKLTGELGAIVDSVAKVSEVATPDVPATSHPIPLQNVFRPDVVGTTLTPEQALAGAPDHDGTMYRVTAILGEEQ